MLGHAYRTVAPPDSRDAALLQEWQQRDPIDRFGAVLVADGVLDEASVRAVDQSVADEIEEAVRFALASPEPRLEDALEDFFAEGAAA
jgi:TPP-dependent pyruvate/acetoin dehydrogenase alpha subunit